MELMLVWRFFLRRWWLILVPTLIVGAISLPRLFSNGASGGFTTAFKYSASQETSNVSPRDGDYQDVWLASEFVVNAFTEWVRSGSFRSEIALKLDETVDLSTLGIVSDKARSIGVVQMSHPDSAQLERIATVAIDVLKTRNASYFPHLGGENATVTLLELPVISPAPAPIVNRFEPLFRIFLGMVAGLVLALVAEWTDRSIHDVEEVEWLGLRVLGKIPKG